MKIIKKTAVLIFSILLCLSLSACAKETSASQESASKPETEGTSSSLRRAINVNEDAEANEDTGDYEDVEANGDIEGDKLSIFQSVYAKAEGYDYLAVGYYEDNKNPEYVRDGYVPYDENFIQKEISSLESAAHGISIRLSMAGASSATEALTDLAEEYTTRKQEEGLTVEIDEKISVYDNDTVGMRLAVFEDAEGRMVAGVLYADIRDDGTVYMRAEVELTPEIFDDTTVALAEEIDDAYGMGLSSWISDIVQIGEE